MQKTKEDKKNTIVEESSSKKTVPMHIPGCTTVVFGATVVFGDKSMRKELPNSLTLEEG